MAVNEGDCRGNHGRLFKGEAELVYRMSFGYIVMSGLWFRCYLVKDYLIGSLNNSVSK